MNGNWGAFPKNDRPKKVNLNTNKHTYIPDRKTGVQSGVCFCFFKLYTGSEWREQHFYITSRVIKKWVEWEIKYETLTVAPLPAHNPWCSFRRLLNRPIAEPRRNFFRQRKFWAAGVERQPSEPISRVRNAPPYAPAANQNKEGVVRRRSMSGVGLRGLKKKTRANPVARGKEFTFIQSLKCLLNVPSASAG